MTPEQAKAHIDLATASRKAERAELDAIQNSSLDAADRIILRKAADASIQLANLATAAQLAGAEANPL